MSNRFSAGAREPYLSDGGTEVFAEVLMLAVSAPAERDREYGFAAGSGRPEVGRPR
ncbi:hypothetical protein [Kitasatospora sp. GP82]|uniref:hypothetical protein n=1 Tax=Kitasatospora sp. GP82 TaxID=3035089 RepID=UPI002474BB41|nr:hypothetical protein [Kitasatospora sp. GP82]MDH6125910.1 hypothetical protein [Kitasatospora sp. GP82]